MKSGSQQQLHQVGGANGAQVKHLKVNTLTRNGTKVFQNKFTWDC